MPTQTQTNLELHQRETADVTAALIRAGRAARRLAEETGTPFIVMVDGKIVDLNAPKARRKRRAKRSR